jgi:hypothetical protein
MLTQEEFDIFHRNNPQMFALFERFSLAAIKAGREHFGAQTVIERIRWYTDVESHGDQFKINNDYAAFYSRLFEELHPVHKGFFRKRRSVADKKEIYLYEA